MTVVLRASALCCVILLTLAACSPPNPSSLKVEQFQSVEKTELASATAQPGEWPWWRGPTRDGRAAESEDPPVRWTATENILWQVPIAGRGHSTPSVSKDRLFLATADEKLEEQKLLCLQKDTGTELWSVVVHKSGFVHTHTKNTHASGTPACDGERVYISFLNADAIHTSAYTYGGDLVWQKKSSDFETRHGYGSSPVLWGPLVIVAADSSGDSALVAHHRVTGEPVWKSSRRTEPSFGTPIVATIGGRDQLLHGGTLLVSSYNPQNGAPLWFAEGTSMTSGNTLAFTDEYVIASGGYPQKEIVCVKADGRGDVTDTHVAWRNKRGVTYVPSPIVDKGRVIIVNDDGIIGCWEVKTGKELWRKRLRGNFTSSPIYAGGRYYLPNEAGVTTVFRIDPSFEVIQLNDLSDGGFASPVICGNRIYLRTRSKLFCIGAKS
ncbi:MAG: PQQ-binding-like beta-propeller repeat protein [Planctomycetota bacterium]